SGRRRRGPARPRAPRAGVRSWPADWPGARPASPSTRPAATAVRVLGRRPRAGGRGAPPDCPLWKRRGSWPDSGRYADLALEDLARGSLRQSDLEPHVARVLVRGHPCLDVLADLFRGGPGVRLQDDGRADLLTKGGVRDPDHGGLGHRRVLVQDLLDL